MANILINLFKAEFLTPLLPDIEAASLARFWKSVGEQEDYYLTKWRQHRLTPLLYWEISRRGWRPACSPGLLQTLQKDYAVALRWACLQEREIGEVLQFFHRAGIEVILLKGVDLRHRVYKDPVLRQMGDLDLLVARNSIRAARNILTKMGYRHDFSLENCYSKLREVFSYYLAFNPPEGKILPVDLHWELHSDSLVGRLTFEILRDAALPTDYCGVPVRVLSPEHLLLHLSLHALDHSFQETESDCDLGQKIVDLVRVLQELTIDWHRFQLEVDRFHCAPQIYLLLRELSLLAKGKVPPHVLNSLRDQRLSIGEMVFWNLQKTIYAVFNKVPSTQNLMPSWARGILFLSFLRSRLQSAAFHRL